MFTLIGRVFRSLSGVFSSLQHLRLGSNPLHCGCEAVWLMELHERNSEVFKGASQPSCASPARVRGQHFNQLSLSDFRCQVHSRHGNGTLGHRVNGSFGSSFTSGSPGHRVIFLTQCETRVFPVFEKMPKMHLKCRNDKNYCQMSVVGLKSLDVSPCNELLLLPMIIKNSLV